MLFRSARLSKIMEEHNKAHNPSGVPFKGEKKRQPGDEALVAAEEEAGAEVLGPLSESDAKTKDSSSGSCKICERNACLYRSGALICLRYVA